MNKKKYLKRILAAALAFVLVATSLPDMGQIASAASNTGATYGVVTTVDDPHTLTRPEDTFEDSDGVGSTLNAGKILVGKSVTDGVNDETGAEERLDLSSELTNMSDGSTTSWLPGENNFLITISQSSQMYGVSSRIPVPLDVVFVLDTSNSMGGGRAQEMVTAANDAIEAILTMNENNRVAVVAFSSRGEGGMNDNSAAYLLSGLQHYDDGTSTEYNNMAAATDHITWQGGDIYGRSTTGAVGTVYRNGVGGGTNIQAGILLGAKQLMQATPTEVTINDQTVKSLPILVVLSDGAPTYSIASQDWWDWNDINTQQGPGGSYRYGNGFLAALTAAYYKEQITAHYFGNSSDSFNSARIYTIGVGVGEYSGQGEDQVSAARLAQLTLNPLERWNDNNDFARAFRSAWASYTAANPSTDDDARFTIDVGNRQNGNNTSNSSTYSFYYNEKETTYWETGHIDNVLWPQPSSLLYNDGYFAADTDDEIADAFKELVIEIQKRAITAPTLTNTTWGQDYSGFVTFTDPIGEYMEVKNIIGITGEGYLYQGISLSRLAEGYDPEWVTDDNISEEQAAFNTALEQAFMDRMELSTPAGGAAPSIGQVRSILDVITRTAQEGDVEYDAGGGNVRVFDYETYGGQMYHNSDSDYGNSFVWFGKVHYPEGSTEGVANEDFDVQFIGVAPKNADSMDWLHDGGEDMEALLAAAKEAGANCIVRSYFMYGAAGGNREGEPADMLHFQLRVLTSLEEPHEQYVSIKAPASLLATQKVLIDDTDPKNLVAHYDELIPSRVIYEVGLRSDINANNVLDIVDESYLTETLSDGTTLANVNADGTINFYTNDWDRTSTVESHERALAHANFEVSSNNSFYRYEENTALYDMNGNPLTTKPVAGQTYQYKRTYYTWTTETDGESKATRHVEMIQVTAPAVQTEVDAQCVQDTTGAWGGAQNQWYIIAGVYSDNTLTAGDDITKTDNTTGSASVVTHPVHAADHADFKYTTWLGNNGKLVLAGVELKSVTGDDITTPTVEADADIDGKLVKVGDILTYTLQAVNTEAAPAQIVITDTIPAGTALAETNGNITATVNGTAVSNAYVVEGDQITWTLTNVPVDGLVQVTFQVEVLENATSDIVTNQANIRVGQNGYDTNITTNPVTGKEAGTPSGDTIPADGLKVGDPIEYKIAYQNTTSEVATITVTDIVPQGTTFNGVTSHKAEMTWDQTTDPETLTWVLQNVQPGASGVITFTVTIDASVEKIPVGNSEVLGVENEAYYIIDPANGSDVRIDTNETETLVDTGDLQLKKIVEGTANATGTFELILTESTGDLNGIFTVTGSANVTEVSFTNGVASLNIVAGETITLTGLPEGVNITVTETARAGYTPSYYLGDDKTAATGNHVTIGDTIGKVLVLNTYSTTNTPDISTMFSVKKTLTSPVDLAGKSFTFLAQAANADGTLLTGTAAETLTATGTVQDGETITITFNGKSFSVADTYYYLVTEHHGALEGITYDPAQYLVKIDVTDNGEGQLVAAVSIKTRDNATAVWPNDWTADTTLEFENSYVPADTSIVLTGTKTLNGRHLIAGEFNFVATEVSAPAGVTRDVVSYGHHDVEGNITFDPIYYSVVGTYTYKITELDTTGQPNMTFDRNELEVVVEVTADADGVLKAEVVSAESDDIEFINTYTTQDVGVTPTGTKTLTNRANGTFNFAVYEWDATNKEKGDIKSTGTVTITAADTATNISFDEILYTLDSFTTKPNGVDATETFTYVVEEMIPTVGADAQIAYDRSQYTFQVRLDYDASTGELTATILTDSWKKITDRYGDPIATPETAANAEFKNLYTPPEDVVPNSTNAWPKIVKNVVSGNSGQIPDGLSFGFQLIKAAEAIAPDGQTVIDDGYDVGDVVGTATSGQTTGGSASEETSISFSTLTFYKPGTYKAWIVENNAGQENHGVLHDANRYLMVITVVMDADGNLTAAIKYYSGTGTDVANYTTEIAGDGSKVVFENIYSAEGTLVISTSKELENEAGSNRDLTAGMFDFTLTEEGENGAVHTGSNTADGVVTFDTLTFINDGFVEGKKTLTYIMKEAPGVLPGITYDKTEYRITVELTEAEGVITGEVIKVEKIVDADGTALATAEVVYDKNTAATVLPVVNGAVDLNTIQVGFSNTAKNHTGSEITIPVSKVLNGRDMVDGEFAFTLTHVATNGAAIDPVVVVDTVRAGAEDDGIVYDSMSFYREYSANVVPGTVITYHIAEVQGDKGGVTYDKSVYEVQVTISDDENDGDLEAKITSVTKIKDVDGNAVSVTGLTTADIDFVNEYEVSSTTFTLTGVTKKLTGRDITAGEFVFEVYELNADGSRKYDQPVTTGTVDAGMENDEVAVVFDPITYYAAGVHTYEVVERAGSRANVTYSGAKYKVVVTVTENEENGTLQAGVTSITKTANDDGTAASVADAAIVFNNVYVPTELNIAPYLTINKILNGRDMVIDEFDFVVNEISFTPEGGTATAGRGILSYGSNAAGEDGKSVLINFASFAVEEAGTYVYEITENTAVAPNVTPDAKTITATIVIGDDNNGKLYVKEAFVYSDNNTLAGDEQTFTNVYIPTPVEQALVATKYLTGMPMADGQFSFIATLEKKDASGEWQAISDGVVTGTNNASGLVTFDPYQFTTAGEYCWTVVEDAENSTKPAGGTMNFDPSTFYVYVTVSDDAATGSLSITNVTYSKKDTGDVNAIVFSNVFVPTEQNKPLDAVLKTDGTKVLNGREMLAGEFSFIVKDVQDNTVATGTNDADGNIIFDYDVNKDGVQSEGIKFSTPGTYIYTVEEVIGDGAAMSYDPAKWTVRYEVTQEPATGELIVADPVVTQVIDSTAAETDVIVFTNTYDAVGVKVELKGYKKLTGRALNANEFEFHLINSAGNIVAKGYNDANGVITFEALTFEAVSTIEYTLVEVQKNEYGITSDETVYQVKIVVTEVMDEITGEFAGKLQAHVYIDGVLYNETLVEEEAQIYFENAYVPAGVDVQLNVVKFLNGRNIISEEFTFELLDENNNVIETAYNDADGNVVFDAFRFDADDVGSHVFYVREKAGDNNNIAYDETLYKVEIAVTDDLVGQIHAAVTVDGLPYDAGLTGKDTQIQFVNEFTPDPITAVIDATKELTGRELEAGEFTFVINDANGLLLAVGTNDADGKIQFVWEKQLGKGEHVLTISEQHGVDPYMTYDANKYQVTVTITDADGDGVLETKVEYPEEGVVFKNSYDKPNDPPKTPDKPDKPQTPPSVPTSPATGDGANIVLWVALIAICVVVIVGKIIYDKKGRRTE